ncbi:MAG: peptidoglycan DD-metalloendopeptidase family protein [Sphingomonas sp.]|nr:peptidoglycan DD-metalloendopeptidase family protein [Sphingomonas sp.]
MRRFALALLLTPLLAGSAPAQPQPEPLQQALQQARAEQASAEAETARLDRVAGSARDEADRLRAQEAAAAKAIDAAEARITAADAQFRLAAAYLAVNRQRLAEQQRPVSSLLAGLAVMARRPPLLALAGGGGGADEFVKVSVLLDSTLPLIRARTRTLSTQLSEAQRLEAAAISARAELVRSRPALTARRQQFAALEQRAVDRLLAAGGAALGTGDVAIAAGEQVERIRNQQSSNRSAQALAVQLASQDPAPPRPFAPAGQQPRPPFAYALPVSAPVIEGLGAVDDSGVRSRGISFATARGSPVSAPADGTVRFSGPFRDYDGVVILDHGGGWMSLIVNISSELKPGDKVHLGDPLGRTLGPIVVELSHNGQRFSPALIAGSSQSLSKGTKGG